MTGSFQLMTWLAKGDKLWSDVPATVQMKYLNSIKQPKTDLQRSFAQYRCQNYFRSKTKVFAQEVVAAILYFPLLVVCLIKGIVGRVPKVKVEAVGEFKGMPEIVPDSLNKDYQINNDVWPVGASLSFRDLWFVLRIAVHYPYSPYFSLKCMAKIAKYSSFIRNYSPKAVIVHAEYTFTSSILTAYCEKHGVKHINVMHGEKLVYIGWSFFRFTKCYVWSEHYRQLLTDMGAETSQFIIEVPPALKIDVDSNFRQECFADYKYYLQKYTEKELNEIIESLTFVTKEKKTIRYRPHPRFSDIALLEKYIPKEQIEYPQDVNILTSISSCQTAIGYCSTVLYQAYLCGKNVILDDVAYKTGYDQLKDHKYVLSYSDIQTLSNKNNEFKTNS